jgi:hypothetical protein
MLTTATAISPGVNAAQMQGAAKFFTDEFVAVALFRAMGLLVPLAAVFSGEQGVWF